MITKQSALSAAVASSTGTIPSGEEVGKDMFELSVEGYIGRSSMRGARRKHTVCKRPPSMRLGGETEEMSQGRPEGSTPGSSYH